MQGVTVEGRRAAARALFQDGKYEDAARELRAELDEQECSESWNDWAATEAMCGRIEAAIAGFGRALQLDPTNAQARENLLALREQCLKGIDGISGGDAVVCTPEQAHDAEVPSFFRAIEHLPLCDPTLPPQLQAALAQSGSDSSYYVRESYRLLSLLQENAKQWVVEVLERSGSNDYRFWLIAALAAFERQDWPQVMHLLREAGDRKPADLFVERVRIHAEEKWSEADTTHQNPFAGLARYLERHFCPVPWENMEIGSWGPEIEKTGNVSLCCPAYLPLIAGNVREKDVEEVWNSAEAQAVRRSILEGKFAHCSKIHCPQIAGRKLKSREELLAGRGESLEDLYPAKSRRGPYRLLLSYDRTCNMACPSCRTGHYAADRKRTEELDRAYREMVRKLAHEVRIVYMDGAGEALASRHSRELLKSLTRADYPHLKLELITNGQLLDRRAWEEFDLRGRVEKIYVSTDGATEEVYGKARKGGKLSRVLDALAFLDGLRRDEGERFEVVIQYVVSTWTFPDMPEAVRLAKKYHVAQIVFSAIRNWGHLTVEEEMELFVMDSTHPQHPDFLRVLEDPELRDPIVNLGSVSDFTKCDPPRP